MENVVAPKVTRKYKKYNVKESVLGIAFASPWIIGFLLLMLFPIVYSFYLSMTNTNLQQLSPLEFRFFQNYITIFKDDMVWDSILHTIIFVLLSVPANIIAALCLAMLLNTKVKGSKIYRALFYLPTLVTMVAVALLWKQIFNAQNGILNSILALVGIQGPNWLADYFWAIPSLVLMGMWSVGGTVVIFLAALTDVPVSMYEACDIDGASKMRKFFVITIPMLSPIIFYNILTATVAGFQTFTQAMLMTGGDYNTNFFALEIYKMAWENGRQGYASAMSWVLLVIILGFSMLIRLAQKKLVFYND